MTVREFADLALTMIQEEANENPRGPWATPMQGGGTQSRFDAERVGDALIVTDHKDATKLTVLVVEGAYRACQPAPGGGS